MKKTILIYTYQWSCTSKTYVKAEVSFRSIHTKDDTSIKKYPKLA